MSDNNAAQTVQYLTFTLDQELYAIRVFKVREVLEVRKITKVPRMDDFMRGVINLRGGVVPVADLRLKFNMPEVESDINTSIVVTEVCFDGNSMVVGILVDSVQEVIELLPEHIQEPPKVGTSLDMNFMEGMGKKNEEFIIIIDIDKVFSAEEIDTVRESIPDNERESEEN